MPVLLIDAMAGLRLLHVPPAGVPLRVVVLPMHITGDPVIGPGNAFTVTVSDLLQPDVLVHIMFAVPAVMPVTTPVAFTVATAILLLVQLTPVLVVLNVVVRPTHSDGLPLIAAGNALTVTVVVLIQPAEEV